jgi:hypothetical protein
MWRLLAFLIENDVSETIVIVWRVYTIGKYLRFTDVFAIVFPLIIGYHRGRNDISRPRLLQRTPYNDMVI